MIAVDSYLKNAPPGYAVLIAAPWGAGKSFWWSRYSKSLTSRVPITISAAGLTSYEDLENALFQASIQDYGSEALRETATVLGRALLRYVKVEPKDIKLKADTWSGRTVVCIDDVERFAGEFSALFGFVVNLLDRGVVHCILMADEEHAKALPGYGAYKERIIGKTVPLRPDVAGFCEQVILGTASQRVRELLQKNQDEVVAQVTSKKISNLRSVRYFITELANILGETDAPATADIESLMSAVAFWTFSMAKNAGSSEVIAKALRTPGLVLAIASERRIGKPPGDLEGDQEEQSVIQLIRDMNFSDEAYGWPHSEEFSRLVLNEDVDYKKIAVDFQLTKLDNDKATILALSSRLNSFRKMSDAELQILIVDTRTYLASGVEVNLAAMFDVYRSLHYLAERAIFAMSPEEWTDEFIGILEGYNAQGLWGSEIGFGSVLTKDELRAKAVVDQLLARASDYQRSRAIEGFIAAILTGQGEEPDLVTDGPIFGTSINPIQLYGELSAAGTDAVLRFRALARSARRVGNASAFVSDDADFYRKLAAIIRGRTKRTSPATILQSEFFQLADELSALADHITPRE